MGGGNVSEIINKIDQQIRFTDFIISKSKNTFTDNIYENLYKVEEYVISNQDIENFSKVVRKLIDRDPNLYNALVWDAKLMSYKNFQKQEIIDRINSAIDLSPANQEAYRFILDFTKKNNDKKLFKSYCAKYHLSQLGGKKNKERSLFRGSSLTRFAIQIGNQIDNINIVEGINLNEYQDYKITLREPVNLNNLQILSNFLPGTIISIQSLELMDINDDKFIVSLEDIYVSSKSSFFIEDKNHIKILATNFSDEKIKIQFSQFYENITQINIKINFYKTNLTNKEKC